MQAKMRYGVIGHPIEHSRSPQIHQAFAKQEGIEISYEKILSPLDGFKDLVEKLKHENYHGVNVTVPFKIEAYEVAQKLSPEVQKTHASNTLKFLDEGSIEAHNTDGEGLVADLKKRCLDPQNKNILIIGAGGAVKGILPPLIQVARQVTVCNRTVQKLTELQKDFDVETISFDEVGKKDTSFDIVINGTSASLTNDLPQLSHDIFKNTELAYDLVYKDEMTSFMKWASQNGVSKVQDGLGMLVEQAAVSYWIWRGFKAQTDEVYKMLYQEIKK